jgi:hypothetical protein
VSFASCGVFHRPDRVAAGKDSNGNDIKRIQDVSTATALIARIATLNEDQEMNDRVAAFNTTEGWVKSRAANRRASPAFGVA